MRAAGLMNGHHPQPTVADFVIPQVLALSYTAHDLAPFARDLGYVDARGAVLASSASTGELGGVELPEGFLAAALAPAVATLSVSQPVVSPTSSERVLYMARQLRMGDGTPLLVVAQVPTEALVAVLMQGLEVPDMELTLERTQGVLLLGVEAPQGTVERQERAAPALQEGGADDGVHAWQASARLSRKVPVFRWARPCTSSSRKRERTVPSTPEMAKEEIYSPGSI